MRVADFFCGGGGFSEGFRQAGFDIVFAVDRWTPAVKTYLGNKPGVKVVQDDVIRISQLPDDEFEALVPDSEVIIGSPPCQSFSHSNKSGNADKSIGIQLIEAYLKIIARKKFKQGSVLRYWVLENVPAVRDYIKKEYSADDLGLNGDFVLRTQDGASGIYNAKYFGAPTNRERYLCGEFPKPIATNDDNNLVTLQMVLDSLGDYYLEEQKFAEFSQKALHIRNNECDAAEFEEFTEAVAKNLTARSLYPLQLLSAYHMAFSQNACNFSVPGAGKTSIVYGAYAYLHSLPEENIKHIDRLLIVGPLSSFGPWEQEYEECFGRPPVSKRLVGGIDKVDKQDYLISKYPAELTLISYASLISLQEELGFFLRTNKVMVVLDEAHKAKNSSGGVIAQAVLEMSKYSKSRIVLTGTPAPNGYEDIYNLFRFIWPNKNVLGFEINQLRDIIVTGDQARVTRLIDNISPYFIRIRKLIGEKAELFVLEFEKNRLGAPLAGKVRRISEVDVTAGYDIISYNSVKSKETDRFIEVKAISSSGFYWSKNEYETAKLKGETYYLYLVDLHKINQPDYVPEIVQNPAVAIMESEAWLVEAQSYSIRRI